MTFTFKLERLDGTPAEPPSFKTTVLGGSLATRSLWGTGRFRSFAFATTTQTRRRCWSLRTWPKERLAELEGTRRWRCD
jgi:hypothetical protein